MYTMLYRCGALQKKCRKFGPGQSFNSIILSKITHADKDL